MENFLRKIKLIDSFSMTLNTTKSEFISALRFNIDEADIDGLLTGAFEALKTSNNKFTGYINKNGFKIRKRKRSFERTFIKATATGKFYQKGDNLVIDAEINKSNNHMILFFGFLAIFFIMTFMFLILRAFSIDSEFSRISPIIGVFIIALFMFGIPYFIMRNGVKHMKQDLEREFHFIISKSNLVR